MLQMRNRPFQLTQAKPDPLPDATEPAQPNDLEPPPPTTDAEGMQRAYDSPINLYLDPQGTLRASGTKGGFLGEEWMENYRRFGLGLASKFGSMFTEML